MTTDSSNLTTPHIEDATREEGQRNKGNHPFRVTIRTMAGHSREAAVKPNERIADIVRDNVRYFVHRGELTDGDYALTLPRLTGAAELDPTATVGSAAVVEADILVLVSRRPQVDG